MSLSEVVQISVDEIEYVVSFFFFRLVKGNCWIHADFVSISFGTCGIIVKFTKIIHWCQVICDVMAPEVKGQETTPKG